MENSPGQNTGAGSLPLLQGIFPSQGGKKLNEGKGEGAETGGSVQAA